MSNEKTTAEKLREAADLLDHLKGDPDEVTDELKTLRRLEAGYAENDTGEAA